MFVFVFVLVVLFYRETPACLMGKVSQLESMVKVLQEDLKKVSYGSIIRYTACKATTAIGEVMNME